MTLWQFYRSKQWEAFRKAYLADRIAKDGELIDDITKKPIVNKYDAILHHKIFLTESNVNDPNIALNADNIILVSHETHNKIHERFGMFTRHIYITTDYDLVKHSIGDNDLIIDVDKLYKAVNKSHSKRLISEVMKMYRALIDSVKTRDGHWVNAWIIKHGHIAEIERLAKEVDGEIIPPL